MPDIFNTTTPNFEPLRRALELTRDPRAPQGNPLHSDAIADFMWMCEHPEGVHQYKHCDTRNYAHLTGSESRDEALTALNHAYDINEKWTDQPKRTASILARGVLVALLLVCNLAAGTVYFTPKGKTYHTDPKCMSLAKSANVLHADEKEAIAHGLKPCGIEAHRKPAAGEGAAKKTDNTSWGKK